MGRYSNPEYQKFMKVLEKAKQSKQTEETVKIPRILSFLTVLVGLEPQRQNWSTFAYFAMDEWLECLYLFHWGCLKINPVEKSKICRLNNCTVSAMRCCLYKSVCHKCCIMCNPTEAWKFQSLLCFLDDTEVNVNTSVQSVSKYSCKAPLLVWNSKSFFIDYFFVICITFNLLRLCPVGVLLYIMITNTGHRRHCFFIFCMM